MFPLTDFNFVCCALATFSAAVGYNVSRRRAERRRSLSSMRAIMIVKQITRGIGKQKSVASSGQFLGGDEDIFASDYPTPVGTPSDITEPNSLKRKIRNLEDTDSVDAQSKAEGATFEFPPNKRCRSSPLPDDYVFVKVEDIEPSTTSSVVHGSTDVDATSTEGAGEHGYVLPISNSNSLINVDTPATKENVSDAAIPNVSPKDEIVNTSDKQHPLVEVEVEKQFSDAKPAEQETVTTTQPVIASAFSIPSYKPSSAFTSFAGSSSAFATSSFNTTFSQRPVWAPSLATPSTSSHPFVVKAERPLSQELAPESTVENSSDPLAAKDIKQSTQASITGEEDEEVHQELRGVKLFIKRGDKEFTSGIFGHVKLLAHRETSDERLDSRLTAPPVFRREPVWKVSMSVRLRPTMRCTFDEDQAVLRLTLKETIEQDGVPTEQSPQQIVVYALKRGKMSKTDFATFAKAVINSSQLVEKASE
ncbi:hypothetical protein C8Q75DRAFT_734130 [Abortiporus biennis]|nr:hypothetical protein C8Q75DRAFT_734130 [Abortiporus biennis]